MFFLPLALAQIYHTIYIYNKKQQKLGLNLLFSILLLAATFASHLAFGYIAILSAVLIPISFIKPPRLEIFPKLKNLSWKKRRNFIRQKTRQEISKFFQTYFILLLIFAFTFILLSYWFVPLITQATFHAKSFWDSPWKWNSYGLRFVIDEFFNGGLLDHDRFPMFTLLTLAGFFVSAYKFTKKYRFFTLLFPFWFILYMGRPTLGPLLKFLPLSAEIHLHRFINGFHLAPLFLAPIGLAWLTKSATNLFRPSIKKIASPTILIVLVALICFPIYRQTYRYLNYNKILIKAANKELDQDLKDFKNLVNKLKSLPSGRLYVGKTGNWGRNQRAGPTPLYMALNTQGFETLGFLPETWSLNSDTEQFFDETRPEHYNLYNLRYVVAPDWFKVDFFKSIDQFGKYYLYEVETSGYFDLVRSRQTVLLAKKNIINPVHYWQFTDLVKNKEHPTLVLTGSNLRSFVGQEIKFLDTVNYQKEGSVLNLFANPPFFTPSQTPQSKISEEKTSPTSYQAIISVPDPCENCYGLFKMTYHPNWQVLIDGKKSEKVILFPAFLGFPLTPGDHQVKVVYQPHLTKIPLLFIGFFSLLTAPILSKVLLKF